MTPPEERPASPGHLQKWDFRGSTRFTPENVRAFERIMDHLQPMLQTHLGSRLRANPEIRDITAEPMLFEAYVRSRQGVWVSMPLESPGYWASPILLSMDGHLAGIFVDREMGGMGGRPLERQPTVTEAGVLRLSFGAFIRSLQDAFRVALSDLTLEMGDVDATGQVMGFVLAAETVLQIRATMTAGRVHGRVELLIPYGAVENFLQILTHGYRKEQAEAETVVRLGRHLAMRRVRVQVRLGSTQETVRSMMELQPADIIRLPIRVGEPIWAYAEGQPVFMGRRIGQANGHVALLVMKEDSRRDSE